MNKFPNRIDQKMNAEKESNKPLITFALLAYNQEQFIREAVEGAFSQTYEPLEIILSDDGSTDHTFAIMQEMAAAYNGPHQILLNRNENNLGVGAHYNAVIEKSSGLYIVSAAGDDISEKNRVGILWQVLSTDPEIMCVHSNAHQINLSGDILGLLHPPRRPSRLDKQCLPWEYQPNSSGCTQVWRRDLHDIFGPFSSALRIEDQPIAFRANLIGGIRYVEEPLVRHRVLAPSFSAPIAEMRYRARIEVVRLKTQCFICTCEQLLTDLQTAYSKGLVEESLYQPFMSKILTRIARHSIVSVALLLRTRTEHYTWRSSLIATANLMAQGLYAAYFGLRVDFGRVRHLIRRLRNDIY